MSLTSSNSYVIGNLYTYSLKFTHNSEKVVEYLHCLVLEWSDLDKFDRPRTIKVKQIYNLKNYLEKGRSRTLERTFKTADLNHVETVLWEQ